MLWLLGVHPPRPPFLGALVALLAPLDAPLLCVAVHRPLLPLALPKRVRFHTPAPSSALLSPRTSHFRESGSCPLPGSSFFRQFFEFFRFHCPFSWCGYLRLVPLYSCCFSCSPLSSLAVPIVHLRVSLLFIFLSCLLISHLSLAILFLAPRPFCLRSFFIVMAFPPVVPPGWSPSSFFIGAPGSHSLYPSFVSVCVPGSGAFLFPTIFLPCRVLSGGSLSVASLRQFMTLLLVVMISFSIGCGSFWCTLTVFCLDPRLSFVFWPWGLLLLCRISLVFFLGSLGHSVVRLLGFSSLSSLLVSPFWLLAGLLPWLFSLRCRLPPLLPPAIAGSCSLSLPSPLPAVLQFLCTVHSFCFGVISPCLHDLLLLGFLLFNSLGYLGASLTELSSVSLRFCVLPGVSRLPHSRLPPSSSFLLRFISFAPPLLCLAISLMHFLFPFLFHPEVSASAFPGYCLLRSSAILFLSLCMRSWWVCLAFPHSSSPILGLPSSLFPSGSSLPFIL